ncbi:MAG: TIM barrel protein [Gemmatimonadota bacterium]
MRGPLKIAAAPITWGVSEVPGWGHQLDAGLVLSEIARAGLVATELGPHGFLPEDPAELKARLAAHGLVLVGGFVPAVLHVSRVQGEELARIEAGARTLADAGAEVLVLAARTGTQGYDAGRTPTAAEWETLGRGIAAALEIGSRHGVTVAVHPHHGTLIEREAEIVRLLESTAAFLCLDTGHLTVAEVDPLRVARAAAGRIAHVHLKDVDSALAAQVRSGGLGYHEAVRRGLYRPLGEGDVDVAGVVEILSEQGYDGWYVLEQDLVIEGDGDGARPLENALHSVRFLRRWMAA